MARRPGRRPRRVPARLGDVLVERRRVGQILRAAAAVQAADHPDDRRAADPGRTAGAVDQARARQLGIAAVAEPGAGLAADGHAADARRVGDHGDPVPGAGAGPATAPTDLRLDRSAAGAADPRDREVGQRILAGHPARIQVQRVDRPDSAGACFAGETGNEASPAPPGQAVRGRQHQIACRRVQHRASAGVQVAAGEEHRAHPRIGIHRCGDDLVRRQSATVVGALVTRCRVRPDVRRPASNEATPAARRQNAHRHRSCPIDGQRDGEYGQPLECGQ